MTNGQVPTAQQLEKAGIDAHKFLDAMQADIDEAKGRGVTVDVRAVLENHLARVQKRYDEFFGPESDQGGE